MLLAEWGYFEVLQYLVGFLVVGLLSLHAIEIPEPTLQPSPTAPEHKVLHQEALAAHQSRRFDSAIVSYQKILVENPDDIASIYELSFSQFAAGRFADCNDTAQRGSRYKSDLIIPLRMMWATCLDNGGSPEEAEALYRLTVNQAPEVSQLRYNYAVTLERQGRLEDAQRQIKIALTLTPNHAGSHALLSRLYRSSGRRAPAILAGLRFLTLEPRSSRSQQILLEVHGMFLSSPNQNVDGKTVVGVPPKSDDAEGDFANTEITVSVMKAAQDMVDQTEPGKLDQMRKAWMFVDSLVRMAVQSNPDPRPEQFAARYYLPYFNAASESGQLETLVNVVYTASGWPELRGWQESNAESVERFARWSQDYQEWQGVPITNY